MISDTNNARAVRLLDEAIAHAEGAAVATVGRTSGEQIARAVVDLKQAREGLADPSRFAVRIDARFSPGEDSCIIYNAGSMSPCVICSALTFRRIVSHNAIWIVCEEDSRQIVGPT